MTCEEFQEAAASYALGVLEPAERAACDAHLAEVLEHPSCEAALRRALATVAVLAGGLAPVRPGDGVWRAIEARAGLRATSGGRGGLRWAFAAVAAAAVVVAGLFLGARRELDRTRERLAAALEQASGEAAARAALTRDLAALRRAAGEQRALAALLDAPGSRVVLLAAQPQKSGSAAAVVNLASRRALVVSSTLPAPGAGRVYQLWVIRGAAAPVPAGFLRAEGEGVAVGEIDPAVLAAAPDAVAVSLEPEGGSAAPTDVRLVGRLAG